jgi:mannitol-1-phosphate 5-dehydrogenase
MRNVTVIGAGKTGRGFVARLMNESGVHVNFIDKNESLVETLGKDGTFEISFFGGVRAPYTVSDFSVATWETAGELDELIFVSVCGPNLRDVGAELKRRLDPAKHYYIVTCENYSHPSRILREAIGTNNLSVSEATVFCTTIENGGNNISSENYPYLQCDADLLDGFDPAITGVKLIAQFGNFLTRKLFTYNAASCVIAYLGWLRGYTDYGAAANDPEVLALLDRNYEVTNRVLCREFGYSAEDQAEFAALSKAKFTDRTIADTVARNAREPQRKLGREERIIGPLLVMNKYGEDASVLEMTVAAMLLYDNDGEDAWRAIKAEKTPTEILSEICGLPEDSKTVSNILGYYEEFKRNLK